MAAARASAVEAIERVSPHPTIPPFVSILKMAYSRSETGSRTAYALQLAMDSAPKPGAGSPACAAIMAERRALRKWASRMSVYTKPAAGRAQCQSVIGAGYRLGEPCENHCCGIPYEERASMDQAALCSRNRRFCHDSRSTTGGRNRAGSADSRQTAAASRTVAL